MSLSIKNLRKNLRFWWWLTNFWTVIVFGTVAFNFVKNGAYQDAMNPILAVYIAILAIYAGDKEFQRWRDRHKGRHPGEIFVIIWTILIVVLAFCEFCFHGTYHVPGEVVSAYIAVLSILALTRRSRGLYEKHSRRK
jgi:uncharacterized membrane protein YhaH (DUF805 family)